MTISNYMVWNAYLTDKSGGTAKISGDLSVLTALEKTIEAAGWQYHAETGSWDEGYYKSREVSPAASSQPA